MASENAISTARSFCGATLFDGNSSYARVDLTDVPSSPEGLRMLAANGNWTEVLALAEKLDANVAAKVRRHPTRYTTVAPATPPLAPSHSASPLSAGTSPSLSPAAESVATSSSAAGSPLSTDAAVRNARLPYVLVQVTANIKMRRIVAAKKVIDELGDIEGEGFRHPVTKESFAPFSLRLIAAFLPLYVGAPMDAQKKLYALLEECLLSERRCSEASQDLHAISGDVDHAGDAEAAKRLWSLWTQRVLRVQRALLHVHIHLNQQSLAHCVVEQVLRTEDVWHRTFHVLSEDLYQLRHVLQLQQLFCLSLHVGDAQRAREVHRTICQAAAGVQEDATTPAVLSNRVLSTLVATSCDAFLAVFMCEYNEAVRLFSEVVERCAEAKNTLGTDGDEELSCAADGSISERTLRRWVLQSICANAQVSQTTCMAYCTDAEPSKSMERLCATMERYVKAEPQVLCNSDPFVESLVRFYTLAGERRANLDRFAELLEVFRCDRSSLPSLDALV